MSWAHHHRAQIWWKKLHALIWFDRELEMIIRSCCFFSSNIYYYYSHSIHLSIHNYSNNNSGAANGKMRWYMKKVEKSLNRINAFIEIYFICIHFFSRCFLLNSRFICACLFYTINIVWAHLMRYVFSSSLLFSSRLCRAKQN